MSVQKRPARRQTKPEAAAETTTEGMPPSDSTLGQRFQRRALELAVEAFELARLGLRELDTMSHEATERDLDPPEWPLGITAWRSDTDELSYVAAEVLVQLVLRATGQLEGIDTPATWEAATIQIGDRLVTVRPWIRQEHGVSYSLRTAEVEIVDPSAVQARF